MEPKNADALFAAGFLSLQLELYDKANKYFTSNLKLRPDHSQSLLYLGQVATQQERYAEARKWYDSVNENDQENYFEARVLLASVIAKTDGADAAITHLDELRAHDEEQFVRITLTKELVLREAKELKRAKVILDDAVGAYPENTELLYARGLVAAQLQLLEEHEQDMRKLLDKDPKNAHALNALGYTLADATDRFDEAHALIEQALAIRPNDPFILDSMGWVQYRMGNHDLAIEYLERALAKREDAEIAAHLGEVLWTTGEYKRAEQIWNEALKKHPTNDVLRGTIEKLKQ
jgi:tetratricopeptide (TPR) repeat protein